MTNYELKRIAFYESILSLIEKIESLFEDTIMKNFIAAFTSRRGKVGI